MNNKNICLHVILHSYCNYNHIIDGVYNILFSKQFHITSYLLIHEKGISKNIVKRIECLFYEQKIKGEILSWTINEFVDIKNKLIDLTSDDYIIQLDEFTKFISPLTFEIENEADIYLLSTKFKEEYNFFTPILFKKDSITFKAYYPLLKSNKISILDNEDDKNYLEKIITPGYRDYFKKMNEVGGNYYNYFFQGEGELFLDNKIEALTSINKFLNLCKLEEKEDLKIFGIIYKSKCITESGEKFLYLNEYIQECMSQEKMLHSEILYEFLEIIPKARDNIYLQLVNYLHNVKDSNYFYKDKDTLKYKIYDRLSYILYYQEQYQTACDINRKIKLSNLKKEDKFRIKSNLLFNEKKINVKEMNYYSDDKKSIVFYIGYTPLLEGDRLSEKLFGSELALISLTKQLQKKYKVFITGSSIFKDILIDGISFITLETLRNFEAKFNKKLNILVISRYINYFIEVEHHAEQTYLWLHDTCFHAAFNGQMLTENGKYFYRNFQDKIDKIIVLSEWHRQNIKNYYGIEDDKIEIIPNAIEINKFKDKESIKKVKNRFIWISDFSRGCKELVEKFSKILEILPDAELHIFREIEDQNLKSVLESLPFIKLRGKVSNEKVIEELFYSEYWLYTTNFYETYCISALEAQIAGCFCIASNVGSLETTIGDRGIILKNGVYSEGYWNEIYDLLQILKDNQGVKDHYLKLGREWGLKQNWENRILEWENLFESFNDKKSNTIIKEKRIENKSLENKIKVKVIGNWTTCKELLKDWRKMCIDSQNAIHKNIQLVDEEIADYYIIINYPNLIDTYIPERSFVIKMEPEEIIATKPELWKYHKDIPYFFKEHHPTEWHISKTYKEILNDSYSLDKKKIISTFVSGMNILPGHIKRLDFIKYIEDNGLEIDIYGKENIKEYKNYLGSLPPYKKDDGLIPYKYTIAIENCQQNNYFTEKILDGILSECLVFYWGCPNINEYLPSQSYILLDMDNFQGSLEKIQKAINDNEWEKRIEYIREAKRKILEKYNVMTIINNLVMWDQFQNKGQTKIVNLKRRPDRIKNFQIQNRDKIYDFYKIFEAVDGKEVILTKKEKEMLIIPQGYKHSRFLNLSHGYRAGVVGCILSHIRIWEELILQDMKEYYLVIEDDTRLGNNFISDLNKSLQLLENNKISWDLLYVGMTDDGVENDLFPFDGIKQFYKGKRRHGGGTFGYLISRKGAKKLLEWVKKEGVKVPIDHFMIDHFEDMEVFITQPHLVFSDVYSNLNQDSDIQASTDLIRLDTN